MKIVTIFADQLYAFHYMGEAENEYDRLMEQWTDVSYLRAYAKQNKIVDTTRFIRETRQDATDIRKLIESIVQQNNKLESFFKPLYNLEMGVKILSLQKGRLYQLRIYAIKIDENLFVVTGGAIKRVLLMEEHPDTQVEKTKLIQAKDYFKKQGVFDCDSFYELLNDNFNDE
jgi:hypothetical protein